MKRNFKKVFQGGNAVRDFLTPDSVGFTPVVELPESLNTFKKDGVKIFIKLTQFVPLANIKSLPSYMMLKSVPEQKKKEIKNLVEYSSGNTVLSLTILSKHFGIPNMHAIITPDVPEHKQRLLRLVGAHLHISHGNPSPGVYDNDGGIYDAKILGKKKGWYNLNQYTNPSNQLASHEYIGRELWAQLGGSLSMFVASIGTGGTITGASSFLKMKIKNLFVLGTAIKKGYTIPGPRGEVMIHKLGIDWQSVVDKVCVVDTKSAFKKSLELIRLGFFVGPSTGMQLHALLEELKKLKKSRNLDNLRNSDGEVVCVFIACDTIFPYIDEYFEHLPPSLFPKVNNL